MLVYTVYVYYLSMYGIPFTVYSCIFNEDITKCLDTYCNTNLYVSTTVFITQGNMYATCFD